MKRPELSMLRVSIVGLENESRQVRKKMRKSKTPERKIALWLDKRDIGVHSRSVLLAYAFVRGRRYRSVEPHCGEFNKPSVESIWKVMTNALPLYLQKTYTKEKLVEFLAEPEAVEEVKAAE